MVNQRNVHDILSLLQGNHVCYFLILCSLDQGGFSVVVYFTLSSYCPLHYFLNHCHFLLLLGVLALSSLYDHLLNFPHFNHILAVISLSNSCTVAIYFMVHCNIHTLYIFLHFTAYHKPHFTLLQWFVPHLSQLLLCYSLWDELYILWTNHRSGSIF